MGTSATVRLIEDVRLIRCPLNTGVTVFVRWGKISANMVICDYSKVTKLDHFSLADNIGAY